MSKQPYLVGIVGASASGKTSFLRDLVTRLPAASCSVVSLDNYYYPIETQQPAMPIAGPTSIYRPMLQSAAWLPATDLAKLLRGEKIVHSEYTYNHRDKPGGPITIAPAPVLLLEGLFLFHDDEIRATLDLRVFIDADEEICRQRRLQRDQAERGYTLEHSAYCWEHHVLPAYRQYVLPYRAQAHLVVANHTDYAEGLNTLTQRLQTILTLGADV